MTASVVLNVAGARRVFGMRVALDGASLRLHAGEWLGLLGPNGAGKSTLIRAIAGRTRLDAGAIELLGRRVNGAASPELGVVPQDLALYPLLTASENLTAFGRFAGLRGGELREQVEWAISWSGLADRRSEPVKGFSGGMRRRLNIACGVLHHPRVVLLDEPTVGVDPQSRERIWEMCEALRGRGAALLLTTHQLDEAQQICDRVTIIDHGRTIADGPLAALVEQTVGSARIVRVRLDAPAEGDLAALRDARVARDLHTRMSDVAEELPALLARVRSAGRRVEDVHVQPPSLQDVFLHLTGRELRE